MRYRALLEGAPRLRWHHALGAGMERFASALRERPDLLISNSRSAIAPPIAEFALAMILAASKQLVIHRDAQRRHDWLGPRSRPELREVAGRTLCVVGLGAIGGEIARLASLVGLQVTGVRRRAGPHPHAMRVVDQDHLAEAAAGADFLVLACPLTAETRGLVDARILAGLTPVSWVVNVARAEVVVEDALFAALSSRRIAGAALDVFWTEPLPATDRWWSLENVLVTPHTASSSERQRGRVLALLGENLARYRAGSPLRDLVDVGAGY